MKPLPLPLRVAAGLAVTAAEHARELPKQVAGLPVTVFSQVLQFSMRLQQHVTELAIKGDEVLSSLRPVEEAPSWATFDEDLPPAEEPRFGNGNNGHRPVTVLRDVSDSAPEVSPRDPWEQEEEALAEDHADGEFDSANGSVGDRALGNAGEFDGSSDTSLGTDTSLHTDTASISAASEAGRASGNSDAGQGAGVSGSTGAGSGPIGLTNYDELTLPQLRARLRRLSLGQLGELLAYEREHGNRPSFVGMLTRRIGNVQRLADSDGPETSEL
ncbi:lipid droplet-associated protein [Amycolatopsis sp.]|uniref:lipid droplet-associated protein n=1 Tax=Amycolatopsis sp. TaxID=37632 RepID=UPI002D094EDC|nr:lipid droplet-associated protein [Amycolatopsis sp.]HVV10953.1 lipid droplet-associated protein [Amycolatopsis sp.]